MGQISPHPGPQTAFLSCTADIAIFGGSAGPGKAQPIDTDIVTPYGLKKLINVNVGDAISNPDRSIGYVSHVHPISYQDEYRITFHDKTSALCGPEHLWLAWRSGKGVKYGGKNKFGEGSSKVIGALQLKKWCDRAIDQETKGKRPNWPLIPVCKEQHFGACSKFDFGIDPYVMGAILGNGCLRKNTITFDIHRDDIPHYEEILGVYNLTGSVKEGLGYKFNFIGDSRKDLLAIMRLYGLDNRRSHEKFIPDAFKWASINDRYSIIQGLLDTDGHVEKGGYVEYSSSSKQLADDVAFILRSLGSTVVITPKEPFYRDADGEKVYCHTSYRLYIKHPQPEKLFRIERKKSVLQGLNQQLNMYRRVVSVEKTGNTVPMRCITVSNPNGLYMCNDFIVTHNSFCLLLDPLRNVADPAFNGVTFRRTSKQVTIGGGLWDTSVNLYRSQGAVPIEGKLTHRFPSGAKIAFSHLEHEKNRFDHQGAQYPFIGFDELTHFTRQQFWYLVTRSRRPDNYVGPCYVRATTNPTDKDDPIGGWVRELVDWWIDPDTGYAIPERSGVIRYMTVQDDKVIWVPEDWRDEDGQPPKSFTFIAATLDDNPSADPSYKSTLSAQDAVTKERLLHGNWNISYKGGMFSPAWFKIVDQVPDGIKWLRYWDFAASEVKPGKNPDWTAGAKLGYYGADLYIAYIEHFRTTPAVTETKVRLCADRDGRNVEIGMEEEKGSAGKFVTMHFKKNVLQDRVVYADTPTGEKTERARPWCALAENGHVFLVRGQWNQSFLSEAGAFPLGKRDQCFVAGTKIATIFGDKCIENVRIGDYVITPVGLCKVKNTYTQEVDRGLVINRFGLQSTFDHPIFCINKNNFIKFDSISGDDKLSILSLWNLIHWTVLKEFCGVVDGIDYLVGKKGITILSTERTKMGENLLRLFISICGRIITERKFRKGMLFITRMAISLIIVLKILSVYCVLNIMRCLVENVVMLRKKILIKFVHKLSHGINQRMEGSGIKITRRKYGKILKCQNVFVRGAENLLNRIKRLLNTVMNYVAIHLEERITIKLQLLSAKIAENNLNQKYSKEKYFADIVVGSVSEHNTEKTIMVPVYNLTVDKINCYYANNILVGNCDAVSGGVKLLTIGNRVFKDYRGDTSNFVIGWDNLDVGTRLIISQWTDSAQNTGILFMVWTAKTGRLIVFDEFLFGSSAPERLISSLVASIRKTTNNVYRNLQGWEWYANDEMFSKTGSGDMRSAYRKYRINLRRNNQYDENGSILYGQRILERSKLLIHDNCQNFSRQMSSWTMNDTKPEGGHTLARAFCNVVSILWEQGKIEPALKKIKPYSYQGTAYFQDVERRAKEGKLYNDGVPLPPERPPSIVGDRTQVDGWFKS